MFMPSAVDYKGHPLISIPEVVSAGICQPYVLIIAPIKGKVGFLTATHVEPIMLKLADTTVLNVQNQCLPWKCVLR